MSEEDNTLQHPIHIRLFTHILILHSPQIRQKGSHFYKNRTISVVCDSNWRFFEQYKV